MKQWNENEQQNRIRIQLIRPSPDLAVWTARTLFSVNFWWTFRVGPHRASQTRIGRILRLHAISTMVTSKDNYNDTKGTRHKIQNTLHFEMNSKTQTGRLVISVEIAQTDSNTDKAQSDHRKGTLPRSPNGERMAQTVTAIHGLLPVDGAICRKWGFWNNEGTQNGVSIKQCDL